MRHYISQRLILIEQYFYNLHCLQGPYETRRDPRHTHYILRPFGSISVTSFIEYIIINHNKATFIEPCQHENHIPTQAPCAHNCRTRVEEF